MKICPACSQTYKDDEINFCLADGATLLKKKNAQAKKPSRANEVFAVVLLAVAVLVFLCLVTYSPTDWSFNTVSSQRTQNWIGVVGAIIADLLFQAIGLSAYIFPALLAMIAWRVFRSETLKPGIGRLVGFLLFIISASGLVHLVGWHGGLIGAFFYQYSANLLGAVGAGILLGTLVTASLLLITNLSFFGFVGNFEMARANFKIHFNEWKEKRQKARGQDIESAKGRSERRREIREGKTGKDAPTISAGDAVGVSGKGRKSEASGGDLAPEFSEMAGEV